MLFGFRNPLDIKPTEIQGVIGYREDLELDFKAIPYSTLPKPEKEWKMDILKDIVSFANANGGYIFIGVSEDKKIAKAFLNVEDSVNIAKEIQQMYDTCKDHIKPNLVEDDVVIQPYSLGNFRLIIVRIYPIGQKPYMITYGKRTLFYIRCDNGIEGYNRAMSISEIREAFLGDKVLKKLSDIERNVKHLTAGSSYDGFSEWAKKREITHKKEKE